jgi:MFS family permease
VTSATGAVGEPSALAVLRNRPFLLLWLSQLATQVGGNMVVYGLTIIVFDATNSSSAVSLLLLSFLAPAVLFSAVAGVYVDRIDRRIILVVTNVLRAAMFGAMFLLDDSLVAIFVLNFAVSTVTVFFAPAEAAMIPTLVPRPLLLAANSIFTFTLNGAFAIGFAALGPLVVTLTSPHALILVVAVLYLIAAGFCLTLPASPPPIPSAGARGSGLGDAERAVESMVAQLREGLAYIRANPTIGWSLVYLAIASSLVGILGVIGPDFATESLGLSTKDFVVVVLPLGIGVVLGVLGLNSYGRYAPRRRLIEVGLIALGVLVTLLSIAGPISRFLQRIESEQPVLDLSTFVSLLAVVIGIAFLAGIAYAIVAIPAQTQLQEELPEDVRGRVFGILNMLVSVASFLPIIIVGPIADWIGTTRVIVGVGILILLCGAASIFLRGPLRPEELATRADLDEGGLGPVDAVAVVTTAEPYVAGAEGRRGPQVALSPRSAILGSAVGDSGPGDGGSAADPVEPTGEAR